MFQIRKSRWVRTFSPASIVLFVFLTSCGETDPGPANYYVCKDEYASQELIRIACTEDEGDCFGRDAVEADIDSPEQWNWHKVITLKTNNQGEAQILAASGEHMTSRSMRKYEEDNNWTPLREYIYLAVPVGWTAWDPSRSEKNGNLHLSVFSGYTELFVDGIAGSNRKCLLRPAPEYATHKASLLKWRAAQIEKYSD